MIELIPLLLFFCVCIFLLWGFPVALTLAGVSLIFASLGVMSGYFDLHLLSVIPERIYGIMTNETLMAIPLFIFMGLLLQHSKLAEKLLEDMASLFNQVRGGVGYSVIIVGAILAASTGIVGATVVAMGVMTLPTLLKHGYPQSVATGLICATGTLGQIIPPSIALVMLGDVISNANQQAQINLGIFNANNVSVGDLFAGALLPGVMLVGFYFIYMMFTVYSDKSIGIVSGNTERVSIKLMMSVLQPLLLIILVLGSIIGGYATPTEAAGVGAGGVLLFALLKNNLTIAILYKSGQECMKMTAMVFLILIGASIFSLIFRGFGGDEVIHSWFSLLGDNVLWAVFLVMLVIFFLGFILDFIEIIFVVVPIVGPVIIGMGVDPIIFAIMIAINLQTSFLTPPFGFALFYLRNVAPDNVKTKEIYKGVIPFIIIQLFVLILMSFRL